MNRLLTRQYIQNKIYNLLYLRSKLYFPTEQPDSFYTFSQVIKCDSLKTRQIVCIVSIVPPNIVQVQSSKYVLSSLY